MYLESLVSHTFYVIISYSVCVKVRARAIDGRHSFEMLVLVLRAFSSSNRVRLEIAGCEQFNALILAVIFTVGAVAIVVIIFTVVLAQRHLIEGRIVVSQDSAAKLGKRFIGQLFFFSRRLECQQEHLSCLLGLSFGLQGWCVCVAKSLTYRNRPTPAVLGLLI